MCRSVKLSHLFSCLPFILGHNALKYFWVVNYHDQFAGHYSVIILCSVLFKQLILENQLIFSNQGETLFFLIFLFLS